MKYRSYHDPTHLYFVTSTIIGWKRVFLNPEYARIVLESLSWLRSRRRWKLYGFVIMPNHLHYLVQPMGKWTTSAVVHSFHSYSAHHLIRVLRQRGESKLLQFFFKSAQKLDDRHLRIWDDALDENIYSPEIAVQKLEYIHNNPLQEHWLLVADRIAYSYSSARYYDADVPAIIEIDDLRDIL